jgi:hypothetical protein
MKRNTLNFWIDFISLLAMLGLIWTGLLIHYVLPPGTGGRGGGHGLILWGLDRHDYGNIHFYLALTLIALMVIHVWLHWSWVRATVKKLAGMELTTDTKGTVSGIVLLIIIVALMIGGLLYAEQLVVSTTRSIGHQTIEGESALPSHISGQTTLSQAAEIGGIPVEQLILHLKLPSDVDINERLGRLKRQYGFEIHDVRRILEK